MFIQTEETPNPTTLKFLPNRSVMDNGTANFDSSKEAERSPLASKLFDIEGVSGVFFGKDFISVSKNNEKEWYVLKPAILGTLMEHLITNQPIITEDTKESKSGPGTARDDGPIVKQIKEIIETQVKPAVAMDGGDISFERFEDGIVHVRMHGACSGCPSSTATLKSGLENMLQHYIPEVKEVVSI
ncbi:MAG: NifU family protein [Alphaproteobacteria bacterium]|jgi:Fe-S cluster biogenesis protein NfuA|nr:NifU family protein [Alphaproteobacteria bacterium]